MRLITLIWFLLLTALSLAPLGVKTRLGTTGEFHNLGHFVAFLISAVLLASMGDTYRRKMLYCTGGLFIAALLELLEVVFYHDHFEWVDLFTDSLGLVTGVAAVSLLALSTNARLNRSQD